MIHENQVLVGWLILYQIEKAKESMQREIRDGTLKECRNAGMNGTFCPDRRKGFDHEKNRILFRHIQSIE